MTVHNGLTIDDVTGALLVTGGGQELGSAQITANPAAATGTAFAAVAGLSTTVTTGARPVTIRFHAGQVINSNATAAVVVLGLFRDGTEIAETTQYLPASQFAGNNMVLLARDNPSPGSHTYEIRQKIGAAGQSANILASATNPALLHVSEV